MSDGDDVGADFLVSDEARQGILSGHMMPFSHLPADEVPFGERWIRAKIPPSISPPGNLLYPFLCIVCGYESLPPGDKTRWMIAFRFEGRACTIEDTKFGVRLDICADDGDDITRLVPRLMSKLQKGLKAADRTVFRSFADRQLDAGNVTIRNQNFRLREMYTYFRTRTEEAIRGKGHMRKECEERGTLRLLVDQQEALYCSTAMVVAYFSWLEHRLVLARPFVRPADTESIAEFIGMSWRQKFAGSFDHATDTSAKIVYDGLVRVAEDYRNTYAHGGFDKGNATLAVHFSGGVGAIPAMLSEIKGNVHASFAPMAPEPYADLIRTFKGADALLATGAWAYAGKWIEGGLDVAYSKDAVVTYQAAMIDENAFEEFLDYRARVSDDYDNYDA